MSFFLGWNLGANDAANVFGTAVSNRIIRFRTAALIGTIFVITGAVIGGHAGVATYGLMMRGFTEHSAVLISLAAGTTVLAMTVAKIPVSMTHCLIAAIAVAGTMNGIYNFSPMKKVAVSWIVSPAGAAALAFVLYKVTAVLVRRYISNVVKYEKFIRAAAIIVGMYGSYSLGANNVANVVGVFSYKDSQISLEEWLLLGGIFISVGIVTFSRRVMTTVGEKIAKIDDFGAVVAVLASSVVVHLFSIAGIPVSSSQAIVGGVIGVGVTEGVRNLDIGVIRKIVAGWIYSIVGAGILTFLLLTIFKIIKI